MFDARSISEPIERQEETICAMIQECQLDLNAYQRTPYQIFPEDIQTASCALQLAVWQHSEYARNSKNEQSGSKIANDGIMLQQHIELLERKLVDMSIQDPRVIPPTTEQRFASQIPMIYYYGLEDHSQINWQAIVLSRPYAIISDTLMLCRLLSMHLNADVRTLRLLAGDKNGQMQPVSTMAQERAFKVQRWSRTASARRALVDAAGIFSCRRRIEEKMETIEPVVHMALSVGLLVIWAYCWHGGPPCAVRVGWP